ncbi:MAG: thiolase family protein [Acidimicrobiia bacterium]
MPELVDAAFAGISMSEQGDLSDRDPAEVHWEVVAAALDDAGLDFDDVDGLIGPAPDGIGPRNALPGGAYADALGHPLRFHASTAIGAASPSAGVGLAALAIAHGMASVVVIPNVAAGNPVGYARADRNEAIAYMARLGSPYEYVWGTTRVADFAVIARRHMHEFGTTEEQLAEVAVAQRHGATLNPLSVNGPRGELTIDEVMASRPIAEPLKLLDCCLINQGAGCIVMTHVADVRALGRHDPVVVLGWGEGHSYLDPCSAPSLAAFDGGRIAADTAFGLAGVRRDDIDVAGISDHFTINVVVELEAAGFCAAGEGGAFVEGQATRLGGRLPINTDGGFLSGSHAGSSGIFTMIELIRQLRHEAGPRQVDGASLAYAHGVGGVSHVQYAAVLGRA